MHFNMDREMANNRPDGMVKHNSIIKKKCVWSAAEAEFTEHGIHSGNGNGNNTTNMAQHSHWERG